MSRAEKSAHSSILVPLLVLPENRFAFEAVSSIGKLPARPIFLYGLSGAGKTHLARHAVRSYLASRPQAKVQHLTAGEFSAEFAEAAAHKTIPLFQAASRDFDLFVLDDVHLFDRRPETQLQLLLLCDEISAAGCQILWTSRNSPGDLTHFLRKLVSRFRAGVAAQIRLPGPESRQRLLEHFSESRQMALSDQAANLLAQGLAVSPRELWSVLVQLESISRHARRPIDAALVEQFLRQEVAPSNPRLDDICRAVARQFGISASRLRSRKQTRGVVLPRQCAMLLARQWTGRTLEQIGRYFGDRDHSTVIHACRRLARLIPHEAELRLNLSQIEAALAVVGASENLDFAAG
ncbi:MAG TPA: DnaA/Hda family protein [Planctomycetaceae bacterium]|nr:DnaA/Hda family protein [Planctomycetaceae bacterium]